MAVDARVQALLERYPDQLDDAELQELRIIAEQDPEVDRLIDAIHQTEALLRSGAANDAVEDGGASLPWESANDSGAAQALGSRGASTRGSTDTDVQAIGSRGASTRGAGDADVQAVASRGASTRAANDGALRAGSRRSLWVALAASIALAVSSQMVRPPPQPNLGSVGEFAARGVEIELAGALWLRGSDGRVVQPGPRRTSDSVHFSATVNQEADLLLVEVAGGRATVLHPEPGGRWSVPAGTHLVQPGGAPATYTPGGPGAAEYVIVGGRTAPPLDPPPASLEALLAAWPDSAVLERETVEWVP